MSDDTTSLINPNKEGNCQSIDNCTNTLLDSNNDWNINSEQREEHHNLNTEQLVVSLEGIKHSFSIATTIDSNDKLF